MIIYSNNNNNNNNNNNKKNNKNNNNNNINNNNIISAYIFQYTTAIFNMYLSCVTFSVLAMIEGFRSPTTVPTTVFQHCL